MYRLATLTESLLINSTRPGFIRRGSLGYASVRCGRALRIRGLDRGGGIDTVYATAYNINNIDLVGLSYASDRCGCALRYSLRLPRLRLGPLRLRLAVLTGGCDFKVRDLCSI